MENAIPLVKTILTDNISEFSMSTEENGTI